VNDGGFAEMAGRKDIWRNVAGRKDIWRENSMSQNNDSTSFSST